MWTARPTAPSASSHRAGASCARSRFLAPGRSAVARARRSPLPPDYLIEITRSALDDVYCEAAARGLLVLAAHVCARAPHGLDDLVERDLVRAIALQREPRRVDCLDRAHRIALDARHLHE